MESNLVSVIIPTCNGADNIALAVKSVLTQTIPGIQIIVVDDNGTGTPEQIQTQKVLEPYIQKYNVHYFCHEKNSGGSVARNTGAEKSNGRFLVFLDDDDVLLPEMVEQQIKNLEATDENVGVSICSGFYVHRDGRGYVRKIYDNHNLLNDYLLDKKYFNTSTIMVKRNVFQRLSGFDESFVRHQDWEFCVRLLSMYEAVICEKPLIIRYFEDRHSPKTVEEKEKYLNYFFQKRGEDIAKKIGNKAFTKIRNYKFGEIAMQQYMTGHIISGFKLMLNNQCGWIGALGSFRNVTHRIYDRLCNGGKKVTYSYDEILNMVNQKLLGI